MKNRIQELSGKYRSLLVMCIYAVFYMIAFFYLEQRTGAVHQIHFGIDAYIPFCEVFIIPYLMWFGYVRCSMQATRRPTCCQAFMCITPLQL